MASVNWEKFKKSGEAKAKLRHSAADERAKTNHTNKDIDTSKTYLNLSFGALSKYDEVCEAYDERLAWLDEQPGANRRKDRVTLVGLYIPAPAGMDDMTARGWFVDVYEIVCDELGDDNVLGGSAQFDETHEYVDVETKEKRMSRAHLHAYAVPEKDGKGASTAHFPPPHRASSWQPPRASSGANGKAADETCARSPWGTSRQARPHWATKTSSSNA